MGRWLDIIISIESVEDSTILADLDRDGIIEIGFYDPALNGFSLDSLKIFSTSGTNSDVWVTIEDVVIPGGPHVDPIALTTEELASVTQLRDKLTALAGAYQTFGTGFGAAIMPPGARSLAWKTSSAGFSKIRSPAPLAITIWTEGFGRETIGQFDPNHDVLDFSLVDANSARDGNQAFKFADRATAFSIWSRPMRGGDIEISGDVTGDGQADFVFKLVDLLQTGTTSSVTLEGIFALQTLALLRVGGRPATGA